MIHHNRSCSSHAPMTSSDHHGNRSTMTVPAPSVSLSSSAAASSAPTTSSSKKKRTTTTSRGTARRGGGSSTLLVAALAGAARRLTPFAALSLLAFNCFHQLRHASLVVLVPREGEDAFSGNETAAAAAAAAARIQRYETARKSQQITKEKKRKFILHVGLPKTGTTFMQCTLCTNPEITDPLLAGDNYVFLGTCPYVTCGLRSLPNQYWKHRRSSFVASGTSRDMRTNKYGPVIHRPKGTKTKKSRRELSSLLADTFKERVESVRLETNNNVLAIFEGCENFEDEQIEALAAWLGRHWDVRIFVAYRPLLQWLPSKYNSISKPGKARTHNMWPGLPLQNRPDLKGTAILPFDLHDRGDFTTLVRYIAQHKQHPAETVRNNYAIHFDSVEVLKLHQLPKPPVASASIAGAAVEPDPLFHHLFCSVLPDTPRTCNAIRSGLIGNTAKNEPSAPVASNSNNNATAPPRTVSSNPSVSLNYDCLATSAFEAGLIPRTHAASSALKRSKVRDAIIHHQERVLNLTSTDFPLICLPSSTTGWLLNLSLDLERSLFPEDSESSQQQAHRSAFERSISNRVFCSVDASRALQDPAWQSFFASLVDKLVNRQRRIKTTPRRQKSPGRRSSTDEDDDFGFDDDY